MAPLVARSLVPSPAPAPTLVLVAQPLILPTPSSSSPPFSPSLSLPFPFSGFHFPRENGETQQCPPHSNACDDNNSPSLPSSSSTLTASPSFSSSTSSPNATPAAMAFFAVGCIILALIVGFCLWFIHRSVVLSMGLGMIGLISRCRRRENKKVFPCCGASSSKRAIRKSSTRQGRAARPSGSSPLNGPMVLPPVTDGEGFPPGLSSPTANNVPMVKQDSNAKWRPLEEFVSFFLSYPGSFAC